MLDEVIEAALSRFDRMCRENPDQRNDAHWALTALHHAIKLTLGEVIYNDQVAFEFFSFLCKEGQKFELSTDGLLKPDNWTDVVKPLVAQRIEIEIFHRREDIYGLTMPARAPDSHVLYEG